MTQAWHAFPSPGIIPQFDGSAFASQNCAAASEAMLLVSQQRGVRPSKGSPWWPTGRSIRIASGDHSGGITPATLDATSNRVYGIDNDVRIASVEAVQAHLDDGYAAKLLIDYSPIAAAGMSGSPGFYGSHSVCLFGSSRRSDGTVLWLDGDPLYDGRRPGIPRGPQWIKRSVLMSAAGMLDLGGGVTLRQRYGAGMLYVVIAAKPSAQPPLVVESWPATEAQKGYRMIRYATGIVTPRVQRLQPGQPLFAYPGGPRVTRISGDRPKSVSYIGLAGNGWGMVIVGTKASYTDGEAHETGLYVPTKAGPVTNR